MSSELHIHHRLLYQYDAPVLLGPQRLNLRPRLAQHQRLLDYQLNIHPKPSGLYTELDAEGNPSQWAYFNGPADQLEVVLDMTVDCQPFDPYSFLIYPFDAARLPFAYSGLLEPLLLIYKEQSPPDPSIAGWAAALRSEAGGETVTFLMLLCQRLYEGFAYMLREEGPPHDPADTFHSRRGSCRDLSTLMIAACRSAGLAARFVSGYAWMDQEDVKNELHAWVEVYLPGAGWRGFDPTQGSAITERHIAMAASAYPERAAPVSGGYGGSAASRLETEVRLR
ncbi:MAG: transglutaminase family protein [Lewinellaceae bacterium]|nr:transglutaminase family protein [Phaeodactylibacter sp.]MCB9348529.1 transglutaminase family protein [Lewinellaceae bacterium]